MGKLKSLDLSIKREMINNKEVSKRLIKMSSLYKRLELPDMSKRACYYKYIILFNSQMYKKLIDTNGEIYTKSILWRTEMVVEPKDGFNIGRKYVKKAFKHLEIQIYPMLKATIANRFDYKYMYLLDKFKDNEGLVKLINLMLYGVLTTYIELEKGSTYLCTIIDWHTKKIIGWKTSKTIDINLATSILKDVLSKHTKPKTFNSNQGSCPSETITCRLKVKVNMQQESILRRSIIMTYLSLINVKNRPIDSIVVKRFWRTIKLKESILKVTIQSREQEMA